MALLFMMGRLFLQIHIRQVKYLNNIVEQDHRFIKKITKPIKGLKAFNSAGATLAGVELHHMLGVITGTGKCDQDHPLNAFNLTNPH